MTLDPRQNPLLNNQQPQPSGYYPLPGIPLPSAAPTPPPQAPTPPADPAPPNPAPEPASQSAPAPAPTAPICMTDPPAPPATPPAKKNQAPSTVAGTIDTVEAIIIALILALTFRAFLVEAFVIPTGSMAPTLLGAHFDVICPKCGYAFKESADVNYQWYHLVEYKDPTGKVVRDYDTIGTTPGGELSDSTAVPAPKVRYCPNCGFEIPLDNLPGNPVTHPTNIGRTTEDRKYPWANNGDRILVLKYLYDFAPPQRWDVIVFKEPREGIQNYIKRLIGRPFETVQIVAGDIYIADAGTDQSIRNIARKPKWVQDAVWKLIYDNDHYPIDADDADARTGLSYDDKTERMDSHPWTWQTPWQPRPGTAVDNHGPLITFKADAPGAITFAEIPGMRFSYLQNMIGYNAVADWYSNGPARGTEQIIKDIHVEFAWQPQSVAGQNLSIVLGPPSNQYRFTWRASPAPALLLERRNDAGAFDAVAAKIAYDPGLPAVGTWHNIQMNNVDHALQVYIDGRLVMEDAPSWTAVDAMALENKLKDTSDKPEISIAVGGLAQVTHLKLMHDTFYTQNPGATFGGEDNPAPLGKDEFFALGDNSAYSDDSRFWPNPRVDAQGNAKPVRHSSLVHDDIRPGIVPRRFLLGRAFFVYWPAGFRPMNGAAPSWLPSVLDPPLVPNTGEMRFIR